MRIRQALATAAVLAAATGSLTACNDADTATKDPGAASSASASESASDDPTEAADDPGSTDDGGHLDKDGLVEAITEGQRKAGSAHIAMKMSGGISAEGDVDYQGSSPEMQMSMKLPQMGAGTMEMRFVDGIVYMTMPQVTPRGKFLKIDPNDKSNPMSKNFGSLTEQMDPLNSIKGMRAGVQDVEFVGAEEVAGDPVDHYRVTVDTAKMMEATGQKTVPGMPETLTYDMWLDDKDLLRRMQFDLSGVKMDMLMSRWGEPVEVQAPPADAIVESPQMAD